MRATVATVCVRIHGSPKELAAIRESAITKVLRDESTGALDVRCVYYTSSGMNRNAGSDELLWIDSYVEYTCMQMATAAAARMEGGHLKFGQIGSETDYKLGARVISTKPSKFAHDHNQMSSDTGLSCPARQSSGLRT